jgi:hypothetical protein
MIIRATKKLLSTSKIKPVSNTNEAVDNLPGEWYANLVSLLRPGKLAIHFLHYPSCISIIIPGKSLNKAIVELPFRVENLLSRHGFSALIPSFDLDSEIEVYTTNSRTMLGYFNTLKYNLEYHFSIVESTESIDFQKIEDIQITYIFGGKNRKEFLIPKRRLQEFLNK